MGVFLKAKNMTEKPLWERFRELAHEGEEVSIADYC